jgi:hypothetical protein
VGEVKWLKANKALVYGYKLESAQRVATATVSTSMLSTKCQFHGGLINLYTKQTNQLLILNKRALNSHLHVTLGQSVSVLGSILEQGEVLADHLVVMGSHVGHATDGVAAHRTEGGVHKETVGGIHKGPGLAAVDHEEQVVVVSAVPGDAQLGEDTQEEVAEEQSLGTLALLGDFSHRVRSVSPQLELRLQIGEGLEDVGVVVKVAAGGMGILRGVHILTHSHVLVDGSATNGGTPVAGALGQVLGGPLHGLHGHMVQDGGSARAGEVVVELQGVDILVLEVGDVKHDGFALLGAFCLQAGNDVVADLIMPLLPQEVVVELESANVQELHLHVVEESDVHGVRHGMTVQGRGGQQSQAEESLGTHAEHETQGTNHGRDVEAIAQQDGHCQCQEGPDHGQQSNKSSSSFLSHFVALTF